ncbi:TetR/AcrR family transcriptional regulator C-terminal domain-containing protein, partial [Pseudomonas sp. KCJK8993]|uniref:TetR/AcrR family transcriptional regulator C-terminal domain-containing protein n=1 Tax=Pseudomonas sp. KCJK8993 TaxID=3344565 RepID=UPI0039062606
GCTRSARADGVNNPRDAALADQLLHGLLKSFALWPQVSLGHPPLTPDMQSQVVESALDMFLGHYQA